MNDKSYIEQLPHDMIVYIIKDISSKDLLALRLTSKFLQGYADKLLSIRHTIKPNPFNKTWFFAYHSENRSVNHLVSLWENYQTTLTILKSYGDIEPGNIIDADEKFVETVAREIKSANKLLPVSSVICGLSAKLGLDNTLLLLTLASFHPNFSSVAQELTIQNYQDIFLGLIKRFSLQSFQEALATSFLYVDSTNEAEHPFTWNFDFLIALSRMNMLPETLHINSWWHTAIGQLSHGPGPELEFKNWFLWGLFLDDSSHWEELKVEHKGFFAELFQNRDELKLRLSKLWKIRKDDIDHFGELNANCEEYTESGLKMLEDYGVESSQSPSKKLRTI